MGVPAPDPMLMLVVTEQYSEPEYGIELSYPSNWTIGSGDKAQPFDVELAGRVFIIPSEGTVGAETSVSIAFEDLSERFPRGGGRLARNFTAYTEVIIKYLKLNVDISERVDLMLGGGDAAKVTYTDEDRGLKVTHIWTVKDDTVYILTYAAVAATYEESLYLFDNIVDSFKFR